MGEPILLPNFHPNALNTYDDGFLGEGIPRVQKQLDERCDLVMRGKSKFPGL